MRTLKAIAFMIVVMGLCSIMVTWDTSAENKLTVEGQWVVTSCKGNCTTESFKIVREGNNYRVTDNGGTTGVYRGNSTEIGMKYTPDYEGWVKINKKENIPDSVSRELASKYNLWYRFKLSPDGHSMEQTWDAAEIAYNAGTKRLVYCKVVPNVGRATLVRVSGPPKAEDRSDRAYQANCGQIDPNRTTPFPPDHEFCPGNLVCMTNFCGGGMGCPYVCCPNGLPYLNHCDCKCYENSNSDCHSYSYCKEKLIR